MPLARKRFRPRPRITVDDVDRFWRLVDLGERDVCWPWLGTRASSGYGVFRVDGASHIATRVAILIAKRKWPGGLLALHSCDNPPCCNPAHLRIGDDGQNAEDARLRGRNRKGLREPDAVLTPELEQTVRAKLLAAITSAGDSIVLGTKRGVTVYRYGSLTPIVRDIARESGCDMGHVYRCTRDIRGSYTWQLFK
jgi:hypothetical protein